MSEFKIGDRVLLQDTDHTTGWDGLQAIIMNPGEDGTGFGRQVRLAEGLKRPDGHTHEPFVWNNVVKITASNDPTTLSLRDRVSELSTRLTSVEGEFETFKETVTEVAVRYAVEHDWCEVVSQALGEMGLSGTVTKTFIVSGSVEVEVPICGDPDLSVEMTVNGESVSTYYVNLEVAD